jgi:hypothetical protein
MSRIVWDLLNRFKINAAVIVTVLTRETFCLPYSRIDTRR